MESKVVRCHFRYRDIGMYRGSSCDVIDIRKNIYPNPKDWDNVVQLSQNVVWVRIVQRTAISYLQPVAGSTAV